MTMGNYAVAVLNINILRDISSDKQAGKKSVALRLGPRGAVFYHRILLLSGSSLLLVYAIYCLPWGWSWLFCSTYPWVLYLTYGIKQNSTTAQLNRYLKQLVLLSLLLVVIFVGGLYLSHRL